MGAVFLRFIAPYLAKGAALLMILGGLYLYILHVSNVARDDQKALDRAAVEAATAKADFKASEIARAKEAGQAQGTKEANDALLPALDSANARADAYIAKLRAQTHQGSAGSASLPAPAGAPGIADGADQSAILADDIKRCTEITVRLQNAQDWAVKNLPLPVVEEKHP